ncbi:MAG: MFS transporter [Pseudomonadota bacterium]
MTTLASTHGKVPTIDEIITTVIMARVSDYFGFFVYGIASAIVFPRLFFPMFDPVTGTMLSFAVFSLAFLARPFASFASRWVQRRIGRGGKIALALMIFGTSTVAIGLLPGYAEIGWTAPILLALLRIAQGLGLGGAWDGITLQLLNAAPKNRKGIYATIPQLGGPVGFCVAASLFFVLVGFLTPEEFYSFGWRFAFFAVMAVNVVSLFARLRLLSTELKDETKTDLMRSSPLREMLAHEWKSILKATFIPIASYALFHMVTIFPLAYELLYTENSIAYVLILQLIGASIAICTMIVSGIMADRYGRRRVLLISTVLIALLCFTIQTLNDNPGVFIIAGFALLGFAHGQSGAMNSGRFAEEYRYSASAMSTNLAWIFGAAFAPLTGLLLTAQFGLWAASLYMLSGIIVTLVAIYLFDAPKSSGEVAGPA